MRTFIALAIVAFAPAAHAVESCGDLSAAMHLLDETFPAVEPGSEVQLATWRASCSENPPSGEGDVLMLCQADTGDKPVLYWLKQASDHQTLGFNSCR